MKIERTENQLKLGNDDQYSERLELSVSDKIKLIFKCLLLVMRMVMVNLYPSN